MTAPKDDEARKQEEEARFFATAHAHDEGDKFGLTLIQKSVVQNAVAAGIAWREENPAPEIEALERAVQKFVQFQSDSIWQHDKTARLFTVMENALADYRKVVKGK